MSSMDAFASAGKATLKGLGRGSKAVAKAGHRTYKQNEAKRKGVDYVDPYQDKDKNQDQVDTNSRESKYGEHQPLRPLPSKEQLSSYQAPPKRNVEAHSAPKRGEVSQYKRPTSQSQLSSHQQSFQGQPQPQSHTQNQYQQPSNQVQQSPNQYQQPPQFTQQTNQYQQPQQYTQQPQSQQYAQQLPQLPPQQFSQQPPLQQYAQSASHQPPQQSSQQYVQPQQQQCPQQAEQGQSNWSNTSTQPPSEIPPPSYDQHTQYNPSQTAPPINPLTNQLNQQFQQQQSNHQPQLPPQPQLPQRTSTLQPPVLPSRTSASSSLNNSAPNESESSPGPKVYKPAPDPTSFAPPPRRNEFASPPPQPPRSNNASYTSIPQPARSANASSTSLSQSNNSIVAPPSRSNASTFDMNQFAPPPKIYRKPGEIQESAPLKTKPPKPKKLQSTDQLSIASSRGVPVEEEDYTAPPKPVRPDEEDYTAPPKPVRPDEEDYTAPPKPVRPIQKKAPPPKPLKKPTESNDVSNELNDIFKKMNTTSNETPITKPKPKIGAKPVVAAKPDIKPKMHSEIKPVLSDMKSKVKSPSPPPVPKSRNYSRPAAPHPIPASPQPPQLDLELNSHWFVKNDGSLPKSFIGLNYQMSGSSSGNNNEKSITLRLKDLSVVTYQLKWVGSNYDSVQVSIANFKPSPLIYNVPSKAELIASSDKFGEYIKSWCIHHKGKTVGRGECWDLAKEALQKSCGNHAFVSTYHHHGFPILQIGNNGKGVEFLNDTTTQLDEIRKGDIIQFKSCTFHNPKNGVTQTVGAPDHTSVVIENTGEKLLVLEQNVNNVRKVMDGEYILKTLTRGEVYVYRPMPVEWAE